MKTSSTPFPYFVPNQLLRSSHLNQLVNFLDESSRFTRVFSMGIGIVQGLKVSYGTNANGEPVIKITSGFGLSSDGFLFRLEQDCEFTHYRVLKVSSRAFDCNVSQQERFGFEDQRTFYQLREEADIPVGELGQYERIADFDEKDAQGNSIDLRCLTVVMLSTLDTREQAVCFNQCADGGSENSVTIKVLLADAKFINDKIKPAQPTQGDQAVGVAGAPPVLRRLGWNGQTIQLSAIQTFSQLATHYLALCGAALPSIVSAYQSTNSLGNVTSVDFSDIQSRLSDLVSQYSSATGIIYVQYLYDVFKDLVVAYEEFAESLRGLRTGSQLVPDPCQFPGFIALGRVAVGNADCEPVERFVTPFQAASLVEREIGNLQKADFLHERMGQLYKLTAPLPLPQEIRITASRGRHLPLSQRAIPFYYHTPATGATRAIWNFELSKDGQINRIPSYHRIAANTAPFDEHFHYDVEAYAFFRIEGLVGQQLANAVSKIEELREQFNLPFDLKCVKLGAPVGADYKKQNAHFIHLELMYDNVRCDLLEMFQSAAVVNMPDTFQGFLDNPAILNAPPVNEAMRCYIELLARLRNEYIQLTREVLFQDFVQKHPGTEHFGGVPKGGTFIIAYRDEQVQGTVTHITFVKRVVADFCLPYYCCDGLSASSVLIEPLVFIYPKKFCKGNPGEKYQVLVYPPGGTLEGDAPKESNAPHYLQLENGEYFFYPDRVLLTTPGELPVKLTYKLLNGREASTSVLITMMQLSAGEIQVKEISYNYDAATCRLTGQNFNLEYTGSQGTVSQWFVNNAPAGNGNPQFHSFGFSSAPVVIGLAVLKNDCIARGEKQVVICPEKLTLDITGNGVVKDGNTFIVPHDGTSAIFNLVTKTGNVLLPGNNFSIVPATIQTGSGVVETSSFLKQGNQSECRLKTYHYQFDVPMEEGETVTLNFSFNLGCASASARVVIMGGAPRPEPLTGGGSVPAAGGGLSEEAITLLNRRSNDYKATLREAEGSRTNIAESTGFAKAMNFIFSQGLPADELDKQFNDTANALFRLLGGTDEEKVALAGRLLDSTFHSYLDKQVAISPAKARQESLDLTEKIASKMKQKSLDLAATAKNWKGSDLKKTLKAAAVDEFLKNMK